MNIVTLTGRLTAAPELKTTNSGLSVVSNTLAVDRGYGDKKTTDFIPVVFWKGIAETVAKYCIKGTKLTVSGSLQQRKYDARNGEKRTVFEVVVNEMELPPKSETHSPEEPTFDNPYGEDDLPF